jgi:hypothetical protein
LHALVDKMYAAESAYNIEQRAFERVQKNTDDENNLDSREFRVLRDTRDSKESELVDAKKNLAAVLRPKICPQGNCNLASALKGAKKLISDFASTFEKAKKPDPLRADKQLTLLKATNSILADIAYNDLQRINPNNRHQVDKVDEVATWIVSQKGKNIAHDCLAGVVINFNVVIANAIEEARSISKNGVKTEGTKTSQLPGATKAQQLRDALIAACEKKGLVIDYFQGLPLKPDFGDPDQLREKR